LKSLYRSTPFLYTNKKKQHCQTLTIWMPLRVWQLWQLKAQRRIVIYCKRAFQVNGMQQPYFPLYHLSTTPFLRKHRRAFTESIRITLVISHEGLKYHKPFFKTGSCPENALFQASRRHSGTHSPICLCVQSGRPPILRGQSTQPLSQVEAVV